MASKCRFCIPHNIKSNARIIIGSSGRILPGGHLMHLSTLIHDGLRNVPTGHGSGSVLIFFDMIPKPDLSRTRINSCTSGGGIPSTTWCSVSSIPRPLKEEIQY